MAGQVDLANSFNFQKNRADPSPQGDENGDHGIFVYAIVNN